MQTYEHSIPLPDGFDKYVLVCSSSGMQSKNYSLLNEVLRCVIPFLESCGYKLIQVGSANDTPLNVHLNFCGQTSLYQYSWLVKHSSLVLANDTSIIHLAGHHNVPLVSCFGPTHPNISGAWFGDKTKQHYITPDTHRPSFQSEEHKKHIDEIRPEEVARAVMRVLKAERKFLEGLPKTIRVGEKFQIVTFEVIPDLLIDLGVCGNQIPTFRFDLGGSEEVMFKILKHRKCNIVTDKPVNVDELRNVMGNVDTIVYEIKENHNPLFVKAISDLGIKYILLSKLPEETLGPIKLEYFDFEPIHKSLSSERPATIDKDVAGMRFRTGRFLLSSGKLYLSRAHWKDGKNVPSGDLRDNEGEVLDCADFWEDSEFFYIYRNGNVLDAANKSN
jgi:hypothetical protein